MKTRVIYYGNTWLGVRVHQMVLQRTPALLPLPTHSATEKSSKKSCSQGEGNSNKVLAIKRLASSESRLEKKKLLKRQSTTIMSVPIGKSALAMGQGSWNFPLLADLRVFFIVVCPSWASTMFCYPKCQNPIVHEPHLETSDKQNYSIQTE